MDARVLTAQDTSADSATPVLGERTARAFRNDHGAGYFSRLCHGVRRERAAQRILRRGISLDPQKCPDARGSAHEIRSCLLVSQRPIIVSIRLRRLSPFRAIQDRKSALQEASAADSMKMMVSRWGGSGWLEQLRKNWPVTASEEFVDAGNLIRYE